MNFKTIGAVIAVGVATVSAPVQATLPTPPMAAGTTQAQSFLFHAGASDAFEVTASMILLQKSQNPQLRTFATMMIDHHTQTTNAALATAKSAGVMAPPPELSPQQKAQIGQLIAATPATVDRLYISQQVPAHQQALAMIQGYARQGDTPALRQAAQSTVPVVQSHLQQVQGLAAIIR